MYVQVEGDICHISAMYRLRLQSASSRVEVYRMRDAYAMDEKISIFCVSHIRHLLTQQRSGHCGTTYVGGKRRKEGVRR